MTNEVQIYQFEDNKGNKVAPKVPERAVVDSKGVTLDQKLEGLGLDAIKEAQDAAIAAVEASSENLSKNVGLDEYGTFSDQKAYSAGDTVKYNGLLYTFTTDHVAGVWDESQVESASLKGEVDKKLISYYNKLEEKTGIVTTTGFLNSKGGITESNLYSCVKLYIKNAKRIVFYNSIDKESTTPFYGFLDENFSVIQLYPSYVKSQQYIDLTIPENATYFAASIKDIGVNGFEYFLYNNYDEDIQNLKENITEYTSVYYKYSPNTYYNSLGNLSDNASYYTVTASCIPGQKIKFYNSIKENSKSVMSVFLNKDGSLISSYSMWTTSQNFVELIVPEDAYYFGLSCTKEDYFYFNIEDDYKNYIDNSIKNNEIISSFQKDLLRNEVAIVKSVEALSVDSSGQIISNATQYKINVFKLLAGNTYLIKVTPISKTAIIGKVTSTDDVISGGTCEILYNIDSELLYVPDSDELILIANTTGYSNAVIYVKDTIYNKIKNIDNFIYSKKIAEYSKTISNRVISKLYNGLGTSTGGVTYIYNFKEGDIVYINSKKDSTLIGDFVVAKNYDEESNIFVDPILKGYYDSVYENYFIYTFDSDGCVVTSKYGNTNVDVYLCQRVSDEVKSIKEEVDILKISTDSSLYGKSLTSYGDSIGYGAGNDGLGFCGIIANMFNMTFDQQAVSGATIRSVSGRTSIPNRVRSHFSEQAFDSDYIVIEGGVNDTYFWEDGDIPETGVLGVLPTSTSPENYTIDSYLNLNNNIYEKLDWMLGYIVTNSKASAKILYVIIHKHGGANYPPTEKWSGIYKAILDCCEKWGILVCDLWKESVMNGNVDKYTIYTNDNDKVHPTDEGYRLFYVPAILKKLQSL